MFISDLVTISLENEGVDQNISYILRLFHSSWFVKKNDDDFPSIIGIILLSHPLGSLLIRFLRSESAYRAEILPTGSSSSKAKISIHFPLTSHKFRFYGPFLVNISFISNQSQIWPKFTYDSSKLPLKPRDHFEKKNEFRVKLQISDHLGSNFEVHSS